MKTLVLSSLMLSD